MKDLYDREEVKHKDEFMTEADLRGQADPTGFFDWMFEELFAESGIADEEGAVSGSVLIVLEKSGMRRAMVHCLEKAGAKVFAAEQSDSYNYMLDTIINEEASLLISDSDGIRGILKHSAELSLRAVMISDRYVPASLAGSIVKAWGCDVYMHYTRPELAGLGAFGLMMRSGDDGEDPEAICGRGLTVCDELRIDMIDPETGNELPLRKAGLRSLIMRSGGQEVAGDWGEIVITSLFPAAEPMIDYRTGDVSRLLPPVMSEPDPGPGHGDDPQSKDQQTQGQRIDITKKRAAI